MKSFKNLSLAALLSASAFGLTLFSSCNDDPCKDTVCQNGGTCNETTGNCNCPSGYEGNSCETQANAKFVGTYGAVETCGGTGSPAYVVTITADPTSPSQVLINNLGNYGCTVGGTITFTGVANGMSLTVNDNKCSTQMNANGTMSSDGKTISMPYTATYPGGSDNCTATLTKQ